MQASIRHRLFQRDPDPASPGFRFSSLLRLNFSHYPHLRWGSQSNLSALSRCNYCFEIHHHPPIHHRRFHASSFFFSFGYHCYRACSTHVVEIPRMHSHIILHTSNKINNHTFLFATMLKKGGVLFYIFRLSQD